VPIAGKGMLLTSMDIDPAHEGEFNRWYDREHLEERVAIEGFRFALLLILRQRRHDVRSAFKAEAFAVADHAINQGSLKQLACCADHVPAESVQPTAVVQILQESLNVTGIPGQDVVVHTVGAWDRLAGVAAEETCRGARPRNTCSIREFWCHR